MKLLKCLFIPIFILFWFTALGQSEEFSLISWNIRDFGKTKDATEIKFIANIVKDYDIIAIQEVVAGYGGAQAVARLADQLNRMGSKWDYRISNPTNSPPYKTERYAFLWKPKKASLLGSPWLEKSLEAHVYREPYLAKFNIDGKEIIIFSYHSRRYDENPEEEVTLFPQVINQYSPTPIIVAGDFNMKDTHEGFLGLFKQGYVPTLESQPTTLKRSCKFSNGPYLNHAIDNIFYPKSKVTLLTGGVVDFVENCENLEKARWISDHLAVVGRFRL